MYQDIVFYLLLYLVVMQTLLSSVFLLRGKLEYGAWQNLE